ncbi:hypothetical protein V5799_027609 [Amblyomma americanum]|uniref:Uncharacterized protein n=1 Tax=Amblyomma americanum TaxID=6943 RepID=A0AAQ4DF83_AMBAM
MTTNSDSAVDILTSESTYQKKYFDSWANNRGQPVVIAELVRGELNKDIVTLRQAHFITKSALINATWVIPVQPQWIFMNGTRKAQERQLLIGKLNAEKRIGPLEAAGLLLFPDMASPVRTLYNAQLWSRLFALLDSPLFESVPTINRASIQQDLGAFLRNEDVGLTLYIAGIRYMWRETSRAVWRAFAK